MFDVVEVNFDSKKVGLIAEGKTRRNADAVEEMAALRRGCENSFFSVVPAGQYKEGEAWAGDHDVC